MKSNRKSSAATTFTAAKCARSLKNDPEVDEAVKLLNDPAKYQAILEGKKG
jgi:hypothetical protein